MADFIPPQIIYLTETLSPVLSPAWQILKYWWWLPLPFILWKPVTFLWLWRRREAWLDKQNIILLEIKMPREILKPIRAMETVMNGLRQTIYVPPDWWEKWIDGQIQLSYSFEIVSMGGETHFYIRTPERIRDSVESIIYAQYPEVEISVASDYTKDVPQDTPNKWDVWAADYKLLRPDPYPIKTYMDFETEREAKEEKRIDPLAGLVEAMTKVNPGEQLWVQFIAEPITTAEIPWIKEGEKIRDELAKRNSKKPSKSMLLEAIDVLVSGAPAEKPEEKKEVLPPEMKLTGGEREVIDRIERKIAKPGFKINIRFVFLGRKGAFNKHNLRLPFGFFASYITENVNGLVPMGQTLTKIHKSWFLPINLLYNRRLYLRKRKIFRNYINRRTPFFPLSGGTFVLNVEELASLFHFPGKVPVPAPFVPRVEAKKREAPPGLPTED